MDTKKLDKWANLLLDTGKRNNLINFKDTKNLTVEVVLPSTDKLFDKIEGECAFEVFDPKIPDEDIDIEKHINATQFDSPTSKIPDELKKKAEYIAQYSSRIKRQNQLLTYNPSVNPLIALRKITAKTREFIEETGVNVAYMAFGFIHWKESESSDAVYRAPILLIPIKLEQASAVSPYHIKSTEDEIIVNPTFAYKLDADYKIKLPEYDDEGLTAYIEKIRRLVIKLGWTVTEECKIGIFSFLKINMYRDLKDNTKEILANQNIQNLLGEPYDAKNSSVDNEIIISDPLIELNNVVDADSSQIEAIKMAKSGKSFVLQGPPGTGKSQTITNIIAECLSDGKKVLFVSEKLAALNVVYDKLKKAGLDEFCLQLHSHKANKREIIDDICHTLRSGKSMVSSKANGEIVIKEKAQHQLDDYANELHKCRPVIEKSLYELYESYAAFRNMPDVEYQIPTLTSKGEKYIAEVTQLLEQYVDCIPSIGYDYRKNIWYGYISPDTSYQTKSNVKHVLSDIESFLRNLIPVLRDINNKYKIPCTDINDARCLNTFFELVATSDFITPSLLEHQRFKMICSTISILKELSHEILSRRAELSSEYDDDIFKLNGKDYNKRLIKQFSGFFSRIFSKEYKQLITDMRLCRKNGKSLSYNDAVKLSEKLAYYQMKLAEYADEETKIAGLVGTAYKGIETDWDYITQQLVTLNSVFAESVSFGELTGYHDFTSEKNEFTEYHLKLKTLFENCGSSTIECVQNIFDKSIIDICITPCTSLLEHFTDCLRNMDKLDSWCHFKKLLIKLNEIDIKTFIDIAINQNIASGNIIGAFKKQFYCQWIDSILFENAILSDFSRISQDKAVHIFTEKDIEQLEINKAKIRAKLSSVRPTLDMIAPGSALAILLREEQKKRKLKPIRSLLTEAGELIQLIKPCFLMSPLSVSTFLSNDSLHFDVVIFDEASQIFPQDAIGAIYRGKQLIVVGDSKQMPPSNFFNASADFEEDDEEVGDVTDFESILDICSTSMQQLRLRWHYRSRYEQLITFSNRNFYDSDLVTFPSSKTDAHGIGVDYYHVDGIFNRKSHTNPTEASFIVDLIYKNIEEYPDRSLGVVAFSIAQQNLIDKLLSKRRQSMPEKEFFFNGDSNEPFFIKNLETVQGDERDTIIFSIAYGTDGNGNLLHNFGPLNRVGGERRLNVAVTRAKCNIQLVTSMHYTDIDLKRTSAEGVRLLREYINYAENGDDAPDMDSYSSIFENQDFDFELEVCEYLKSRGFSVDTQVGCSGSRVDLALKIPNSLDYILAIECDGPTYHSLKNARDRDRLRQEVLERMGWKFYRIWSTDWFRNKAFEQLRLLEVATDAIKCPKNTDSTSNNDKTHETFEESMIEQHFEFAPYKSANIDKLLRERPQYEFLEVIKSILEIESPLSEDLLLKRIVRYFGREKVTSVVQRAYETKMYGYRRFGIMRKNGFLYMNDGREIRFRKSGDIKRDIKQIAPEELAAGMLEIIKRNVTVDKGGLYRSLAAQCGISRIGNSINEFMDAALCTLNDYIIVDDEQISLK